MNITEGKIVRAQKVIIYGPEGVGKTTLASQFPNPLFIDTEGGTSHLNVRRLDTPTSWTMLKQQVVWVKANPTVCDTLVIDTADWAEALCIQSVVASASDVNIKGIEDFGYGKGYVYLAEEFGRFLNLLSDFPEIGINVVLTAHSKVKKFEQPDERVSYDRWELKLSEAGTKKVTPLVKEWADTILFINYKVIVETIDKEGKKGRGRGGQRVVYTTHQATWDAKNRWGLPDEIPLDYALIAPHIPVKPAVAAPAASSTLTPQEPYAAPVINAYYGADTTPPTTAPAKAVNAGQTVVFGQDGSQTVTPTTPDQPPSSEHLKPLFDLMAADGITDEQVRDAIAVKGWKTKETPMANYESDLIAYLVSDWVKLRDFIKEREVPFK